MDLKCKDCNKKFSSNGNLNKHRRIVHNLLFELKCDCGREFLNSQSLNSHYRWCLIHRDGKIPEPSGFKGKLSKFKGKKLEEIVSNHEETRRKISKGNLGRRFNLSEDAKRKISEARIKYLETSPHIKWFEVGGIKVQGTWEYNVGLKLLELGYSISRPRIKYGDHKIYTPDFSIFENVFIEVKGWLSQRDIVKYQKVFKDHPDIKIYLIRDEKNIGNYSKFISGKIRLIDCEDLKFAIGI